MESLRCRVPSKQLSQRLSCVFVSPQKSYRSYDVQVDNKGIVDGLWRAEMRSIGPRAKDADFWIFGRSCTEFIKKALLVEVEHVNAHRSKKEMQQMSLFEKVHH